MADKEKLIDRALKYVHKGYLDRALAEYRKVLEIDPMDTAVRLRIGDIHIKMGRREEAIEEYGEVAKYNTQKGFYLKAIAVYKQILKLDENNLDIHYKLADLYTRQRLIADAVAEYGYIVNHFEKKGKSAEVMDLLKKMVEIAPDNAGVRLKLAEKYRQMGYKEDAVSECLWVADRLVSKERYDKAEKVLLDFLADEPGEVRILGKLVALCESTGRDEDFARYAKELAALYAGRGDGAKALELYEAVLARFPGDEQSRKFVEEARGRAEAAAPPERPAASSAGAGEEEAADEPLVDFPDDEFDEEEAADEIEFTVEDLDEADRAEGAEIRLEAEEGMEVVEPEEIIELEEAEVVEEAAWPAAEQQTAPAGPGAEGDGYVDLARELGIEEVAESLAGSWAGRQSGEDVEEFKDDVGEQLGREDAETHFNLGIAYMEMELYENAVREFTVALRDRSCEFECYTRLGHCSMALGRPDDAVRYFLKCLKVEGMDKEARKAVMYELAMAYEASGRRNEALEIFSSVHQSDPGYRNVAEDVRRLADEIETGPPTADEMIEVELI
ncbi:MAG TPA: tetratricopeptide repeat protein [Deltaproteobacteria bacterium]|nr:tetratricopeptide repeat protein [Deltaproteobacteria bacterium]